MRWPARHWARLLPALLALAGCAAPSAVATAPPPSGGRSVARVPAPAKIADLVGDGPDAVMASLGTPSLRRKDGEAEVWLYQGTGDCRVDLVFYREAAGLRLTDARTRAKVERDCLQRIAALPPTR